ncbi:bicarbonate transporter BicA [mine drainage metagenome]|uniref:Bicarbonate transporter BicA n=1 Tax=mine drainage metagenome TaxID=410659 RepID=A0A1J5S2P2_9ZZZZ
MRWSGRQWLGDALGGAVVALLSLPMTVPLGALAFAPLGAGFLPAGVAAAFCTAIVGGLVAALAGGSPLQISGPRASMALMSAGAIATALDQGARPDQAVAVAGLSLALAGGLQVLIGRAGMGRVVRYLPYPVLAGFVNGVALLILLGQLAALLGLPPSLSWRALPGHWRQVAPLAPLEALATMALMAWAPRLTRRLPPLVLAFAGGSLVDLLLRSVGAAPDLGPRLVAPEGLSFWLRGPALLAGLAGNAALPGWLAAEMPVIVVLALVGSLESLLSALSLDAASGSRHDPRRELLGQGLGNLAAACCGGIAGAGAPIRGLASYRLGGRSRRAAVIQCLLLLALLCWGRPLLMHLSYAVMAGIMVMVALSMGDLWLFRLLRRDPRRFGADALVAALVAVVSVTVNLAMAVLAGVALTLLLFMLRMSRPVVRTVRDGAGARSRRQRPLAAERYLAGQRQRLRLASLDGPLFFGTADRVCQDLAALWPETAPPGCLILDLGRVGHVDLAGLRMLDQLRRDQERRGHHLLLAGVDLEAARWSWLRPAGLEAPLAAGRLFAGLDQALEAAEDLLLAGGPHAETPEVAPDAFALLAGLPDAARRALTAGLERRGHDAGAVLFRQGEAGDGLYLLSRGDVEIRLPAQGSHPPLRLARLAPGTLFGEMALLDGSDRSADAVAVQPCVCHVLSPAAFAAFSGLYPAAAAQILRNIGGELAERLRLANSRWQDGM